MSNASPPARRRPPPRPVEVRRVERISAHMVRVTFGGEALADFRIVSPTGHVKVFLPQPGQDAPTLPVPDTDGQARLPEGAVAPVVRTYTPRRFDADRGELDVEFVLHGTGPASTWAEGARPGDRAAVAGPGRGYDPDPAAEWFLIAGDESALPAIGMLLEALPAGVPATVLVEVGGPDDEQDLPVPAGVTLRWLHRGEAAPGGDPLESAIRDQALPEGDGRVWVAGEAAMIRRVRAQLTGPAGLAPEQVVTRGYWKQGAANHPDHDYGND